MSAEISRAREAALFVLSRCRRFDAWSQQSLDNARNRFSLDGRDAALCSRLCLSVLQNAALCDFYIDRYSSVSSARMEPQTRDILRLGICQILFMDRIPDSASVSQSVELAKRHTPRASGLVNGVLRRIAENKAKLPEIPAKGTARGLSVRFSHPLWICEKIVSEYGYSFAEAFFSADNREPGLTLTANLCRTDAVSLAETMNREGINASVSSLSAVSVDVPDGGSVKDLPGFAEGLFFVQDAAAASSILSAAPQPEQKVLDVCAAPGGKSLLCASLMKDRGEIVACDISEKKLSRIAENAERLGFHTISVRRMDAGEPDPSMQGRFDLVICDAPCSGLGVIRKKPEIRYKSQTEIRRLPEVQGRILRGASQCVRSGGTLLYSTCTVLKEENEDVAEAFLAEHPEFRSEEMRTIWPQDHDTDGFFYCRMRRT